MENMIPASTLAMMRKHSKLLLWDTCQLIPATGTARVISGSGVLTETPAAPRVYNGSTSIPCRVDLARAFRPGELREQVTIINNYEVKLPHDVVIDENDDVVINGVYYKIRKLTQSSDFDVATSILVFVPGGTSLDNN